MVFNPEIHHRHSIRLPQFDYSQSGAYFVTICSYKRECLFGDVWNGQTMLNEIGNIVEYWWNEIPNHFGGTDVDQWHVVMPNHFHGIIWIHDVGADRCVRPIKTMFRPIKQMDPNQNNYTNQTKFPNETAHSPRGAHIGAPLPTIVQWFKTMTTNAYFKHMKSNHIEFGGRLWQRNYYEHIIRNEADLFRIREYIINNPVEWELDNNHPTRCQF